MLAKQIKIIMTRLIYMYKPISKQQLRFSNANITNNSNQQRKHKSLANSLRTLSLFIPTREAGVSKIVLTLLPR